MSDLDAAYAAGLFDGEGTVLISKTRQYHNGLPAYCLQVSLVNTHRGAIDWLKERYGGTVYENRSCARNYRVWAWRTGGSRKAEAFLRDVFPYLRIKRDQAMLGFSFLNRMGQHRGPGVPLSDEEIAARDELRLLMHELKAGEALPPDARNAKRKAA